MTVSDEDGWVFGVSESTDFESRSKMVGDSTVLGATGAPDRLPEERDGNALEGKPVEGNALDALDHPTGIEGLVEDHVEHYHWYGSGKMAFRDGLRPLGRAGDTVLLPAYLPDAVTEPVTDVGFEPEFYRLTGDLTPDLADIEARLGAHVAAVLSVDYFGFPQPARSYLTERAEAYGAYHVEDAAHAPLSFHDGKLLGTSGHVGFTSLWKLFSVPNGALLYCSDDEARRRCTPSRLAGVSDEYDSDDVRFLLGSALAGVLDRHSLLKRSVVPFIDGCSETTSSAAARYESGKTPASKLSVRALRSVDLEAVRRRRRANYRAWSRFVDADERLEPVFDELPAGVCPHVFPVKSAATASVLDDLRRGGMTDANTWPRLAVTVRTNGEYETSTRLSRSIVTLPVHQHLPTSDIDRIVDRLV